MRTEYDFASLGPGVRGKHLRKYRSGTNLVLLEPDVARAFPTDDAVNEALRTVMKAAESLRRRRTAAKPRAEGATSQVSDGTKKRRPSR